MSLKQWSPIKKRPHGLVAILAYALLLALASLALVGLGWGGSLMLLFIVPSILAAFFYDRLVYGLMTLLTAAAACWVILQNSKDVPASLTSVAVAAASCLVMDEIIHFLVRSRQKIEETLRRRNGELALLNRGSQELIAILDMGQVTERLLQEVTETIGAESASIWLWDETREGGLVCQATYRHDKSRAMLGMRLAPGQGIAGWVAATGQNAMISDVQADDHFFPEIDAQIGFHTVTLLSVPLQVRQAIIGVLEVVNKRQGNFDPDDLALVETLAASAAIAIDNARLVAALREREEQVRSLIEQSIDGIILVDQEGAVAEWNEALEQITGIAAREALGHTLWDTIAPMMVAEQRTPEMHKQLEAGFLHILETGQSDWLNRVMVQEYLRADGTRRAIQVTSFPIKTDGGFMLGGIVRDVTEQARAEKALRESEEQYRALFETSSDAVFLETLDGQVLDCNTAACGMYGYRKQALLQLTVNDLIPHEMQDTLPGNLVDRLKTGDVFVESRGRRRDGTTFPTEVTISLVEIGDRQRVVVFVRDISKRKQAEEAMLKASRMDVAATLAGGVAHQVNNLMTSVLGNAELLRIELVDSFIRARHPDLPDMLQAIAQSAREASTLAQQLLAYAQIGSYRPTEMNLNDTIWEVLQPWVTKRALTGDIKIDRRIDPKLWNIKADATQMSEIVFNLLTNAVEAIESSGQITITTRNLMADETFCLSHPDLSPGPYAYLSVQDTGCGISEDVLSRIFEPFFSTKFQGRGLGLAAAHGIVKSHGGDITVYSESGQGAAFKVYLPAVPTAIVQLEQPEMVEDMFQTGTETILVIEDDESVYHITQRILKRLGYQTLYAHNGEKAVKIAQTFDGEIHLALLDMGMPVMGGTETYPLLRAARPDIKVVICSGYDLDATAQSLLDIGVSAFVQKPFRIQSLGAAIRKALES
ncbi:MAG: PAS domain S-box protein [Anaerolineae bacterium]|nr:PAS domain S-box protein [Anaerolineae bacterium]